MGPNNICPSLQLYIRREFFCHDCRSVLKEMVTFLFSYLSISFLYYMANYTWKIRISYGKLGKTPTTPCFKYSFYLFFSPMNSHPQKNKDTDCSSAIIWSWNIQFNRLLGLDFQSMISSEVLWLLDLKNYTVKSLTHHWAIYINKHIRVAQHQLA